jgi:ribonuclease VapC
LIILDASVVLAKVFGERGRNLVPWGEEQLIVGAFNLGEVVSKLVDNGVADWDIRSSLARLSLTIAPLTEQQAITAAFLRAPTRAKGLSLGDRCCLALALELGAKVMTADRAWAGIDLGVEVEVIR